MTIDQATKAAASLGITLTYAEEGSEAYRKWASAVRKAKMHFDLDDMSSCSIWIAEADHYAIVAEVAL